VYKPPAAGSSEVVSNGFRMREILVMFVELKSNEPAMFQSATKKPGLVEDHNELLALEILTHSKVYCFAHG
jgi:hypothetical protein